MLSSSWHTILQAKTTACWLERICFVIVVGRFGEIWGFRESNPSFFFFPRRPGTRTLRSFYTCGKQLQTDFGARQVPAEPSALSFTPSSGAHRPVNTISAAAANTVRSPVSVSANQGAVQALCVNAPGPVWIEIQRKKEGREAQYCGPLWTTWHKNVLNLPVCWNWVKKNKHDQCGRAVKLMWVMEIMEIKSKECKSKEKVNLNEDLALTTNVTILKESIQLDSLWMIVLRCNNNCKQQEVLKLIFLKYLFLKDIFII